MKKLRLLIVLSCLFVAKGGLLVASPHLSLGGGYISPLSDMKEVNDNAIGIMIQIEDRAYCNLWYGLRLDYAKLDTAEDYIFGQNYYEKLIMLSPEIRYVFNSTNNYENNFMPYIQGILNFSSIKGTDEKGTLGVGSAIGGGLIYGFKINKYCLSIDLNALYTAPNFIYRDDGRKSLKFLNIGLSLGVRL